MRYNVEEESGGKNAMRYAEFASTLPTDTNMSGLNQLTFRLRHDGCVSFLLAKSSQVKWLSVLWNDCCILQCIQRV